MKSLFKSTLLITLFYTLVQAEQVVISEVMYHPPAGGYEFVEIQNLTATRLTSQNGDCAVARTSISPSLFLAPKPS